MLSSVASVHLEDWPSSDDLPVDALPGDDVALRVILPILDAAQRGIDGFFLQVDEGEAVHLGDGLVVVHGADLAERDDGLGEARAPFGRLPHGDGEAGEAHKLLGNQELGDFEVQPVPGRPELRNAQQLGCVAFRCARDNVDHAGSKCRKDEQRPKAALRLPAGLYS